QRTATGELGQITQQRFVDAEITQLLRIRYHQTRELGANDPLPLPLGHADEVDTFVGGRGAAAVAPGPDLLEGDYRALAVRRHHADLRVQEVDELTLGVHGVHQHFAGG